MSPPHCGDVRNTSTPISYQQGPTSHTENTEFVITVPLMDTTGDERHVPSDEQIEAESGTETQESAAAPTLEQPAKSTSPLRPILVTLGVLLLGLFAASQIYLITSLQSTQGQIESLDDQVTDLGGSMYDMSQTVDAIATDAKTAAANNAGGGATPAPAVPAGFLPRYSGDAPDQALGMELSVVEGPDAYTESALSIDPADGVKRVWMVWAHWCPYCQQELPELNTWWPGAKDRFPGAELVTVTTSMDPARGNPLEPYLDESQFVFPVVVDVDTKVAAQMGVNAFPFWLVTDGDGRVLFRTAGALQVDQVEQLFTQLLEFEA